jgi:quercetin dioxygenase-like cupin family protein
VSKHRLLISTIVAAGLVAVMVVPVLGTPGSNVISGAILARGDFLEPTDVKFKFKSDDGTEVASVQGAGDVIVQRIELGPEGSTGWHTHPGPAVAVVHSGSLTILSAHDGACESVTYTAGESFVDQGQGHVHLGRNPSSSAGTTVFVTYFAVPAGAAGPRIDAPDPGGC